MCPTADLCDQVFSGDGVSELPIITAHGLQEGDIVGIYRAYYRVTYVLGNELLYERLAWYWQVWYAVRSWGLRKI